MNQIKISIVFFNDIKTEIENNKYSYKLKAYIKDNELTDHRMNEKFESKLIYLLMNITKTQTQNLSKIITNYQKFKIYIKDYNKKKNKKPNSDNSTDNITGINRLDGINQLEKEKYDKEFLQVFETKENTLEDMEKQEIIDLNKNISDLKDIFINVQNMVVQQGDLIDRIDMNIEQTMNYVDDVK